MNIREDIRSPKLGRILLIVNALFVCFILMQSDVRASPEASSDAQVNTSYIYNFFQFISWPDEAFDDVTGEFVIGILGEDRFSKMLRGIQGEAVHNRKIVIKRFDSVSDIQICHALFIGLKQGENLERVLQAINGRSVLTIGGSPDFARRGGIVNIVEFLNDLRFEINLHMAKKARLDVSSQILTLALEVY